MIKIYENIIKDPRYILKQAESEAQVSLMAQVDGVTNNYTPTSLSVERSIFTGYRCFLDGSWKEFKYFLGIWWFCSKN